MTNKTILRSRFTRWAWLLPLALATIQLAAGAWALARGRLDPLAWLLAGVGFAALFLALGLHSFYEGRIELARRSASASLRETAEWVESMAEGVLDGHSRPDHADAADALAAAVGRLLGKVAPARLAATLDPRSLQDSRVISLKQPGMAVHALTRSGLFESPLKFGGSIDPMASQEFSPGGSDMIARLEPRGFRWVDSSPAEQAFLGWPLAELRKMSFLDVVHPEHRDLAREQLRAAIAKGEAHGLVYRIKTARGEVKAVEVNASVRYATDSTVDHLRCHVADVTERLRASRELRRRTRDLLAANELLLRANRELKELKDLYSDLYQNAPAMYFSLDEAGTIKECNETLLKTLGYDREDLVDRPYVTILPEWRRPMFAITLARFRATGRIEVESRWVKKDGEMIDVLVKATAVLGRDGSIVRSRSLAQDITSRKVLEAELREKHARLARANEDLERKNKELDEFTHVVSHDLQEPLRTMIAFSEILEKEQRDRLGDAGREHARYLVEASRRMRLLIRDLLSLSRAGRAAGEFSDVDLEAVVAQVRADFAAALASSGAELSVEGPLPPIWGDRDRVAQLLGNLVGNAVKYRRPDVRPEVRIAATRDESGATTISVADNGIGIDPRFHAKIFQIFRRLHAGEEFEGTGAGLAICQKIAHAHGGRIWVESATGRGATFLLWLPGRAVAALPLQAGA